MRAASATRRTSIGVLLPSDAKRSQSRSSGSVLAESIVDCVDGEISLPHHPNGIVPEKSPSHARNLPRAGIVDGKPTFHSQSILCAQHP